MKTHSWIKFYGALLLLGLSNLALAAELSQPAKSIIVASSKPQFTITLASNPTTGYAWLLENYDSRLITLLGHANQRPDKALPGSGGVETWTFKINDAGFIAPQLSKITLRYARPWDIAEQSKKVEFNIVTR